MDSRITPLVLCGGSGTRLWPLSREALPKQFIVLQGKHSPFQQTMLRMRDEAVYASPVVVAAESQRGLVERQLAEIGMTASILLEPVARDSGPAILAGCLLIGSRGSDCTVAVLASDHLIEKTEAFHASLAVGEAAALGGAIVTFGIAPTEPATNFGYIEPGEPMGGGVRKVGRFAEKPDQETAARYIEAGYLWNSGSFLARPETIIAEYKRLRPDSHAAVVKALAHQRWSGGAIVLDSTSYAEAERLSIDYAVMEATPKAAVLPSEWGWSDIGSWQTLWEIGERDESDNVMIGTTESLDSRGCYVRTRGPFVSVIGAQDLVVIAEPDAVLVADRRNSADIKRMVDKMRHKGVPQATQHSRVHRPWGWYEVRDFADTFQVKRIAVYPGGRLSLQKHRFRAEHWVVVQGTARVTVDDEVKILSANEHAEIPLGAVHRLENHGNGLLEIVEVQYGTYLGEDDIIRIEDIYDRVLAAE